MDQLAYYGLTEEPFSIMPLTTFYYHSDQHDQAHLRIMRTLEGMKGLGVVVGAVGTGKSLLARRLLESLSDDVYEVSLLMVLHRDVDSTWLVRRIAAQFGIDAPDANKVTLLTQLYARLEALAAQGKKSIVLIDEAHMLGEQQLLEELRGLLNLDLPEQKLISIILFGLPDLDDVLLRDPALKQRTAVRCELKPFSESVVGDYIRFRLLHAGVDKRIFSDEAIERVFHFSGGNPRLVNVLCDNALFEGFVRKAIPPLKSDLVTSVASDLRL